MTSKLPKEGGILALRLYRRVLKLNKLLPLELRAIGTEYAKDEFRRHKSANSEKASIFIEEWQKYCETLEIQLSGDKTYGKNLEEKHVDVLSQEQMGQLFELQQETFKPKSVETGDS